MKEKREAAEKSNASGSGKESMRKRRSEKNMRDGTVSDNERERSSREVECIQSHVKKARAEEKERAEDMEQDKDERRYSLM
jgi:hypothetical protein